MGGVRDRPGRAQPTSGIWSLRHLPRLSGVGRVDAVELARLAGRLSVLVPPLAAGWVWQRQQLPISWGTAVDRANVAVGRLVAVVEDEVDRLYLAAVAAAQARVAVASSRPRRDVPAVVGYPACAVDAAARHARHREVVYRGTHALQASPSGSGTTVSVDLKPLSGRNSTMWICSAPKPRSKSS